MRPREKALSLGIESLSDTELVAVLLGSGYKGCNALQLAGEIIVAAGGLAGLMKMSINEAMKIKGVKLAKAAQFGAALELVRRLQWQSTAGSDAINSPSALINWLKVTFGLLDQEHLTVIFLDVRNRVKGYRVVFKGSIDSVHIQPRDIFSQAIREEAARIIIAHNHPSQDVSPSAADEAVTRDLCQLGKIMNIPVIDHVIVSHTGYYSFKEHNRV